MCLVAILPCRQLHIRGDFMDQAILQKILDILDKNRLMTVATLRPDGWPQATTVGYANDGLTPYFLCSPQSQKAQNLAKDDRVSLTIDRDTPDPLAITGLSMAARAVPVKDPDEINKALRLLATKYPEYASLPAPGPEAICPFRVMPTVISVLDHTGFGHTDLVSVCMDHPAAPPEFRIGLDGVVISRGRIIPIGCGADRFTVNTLVNCGRDQVEIVLVQLDIDFLSLPRQLSLSRDGREYRDSYGDYLE